MKLLVALISLVLIAAQPLPGVAQTAATSAKDVARLSDEEVRRLLLERLAAEDAEATVEAPFNPALTAYALQQELGLAQRRAGEIAASFPTCCGCRAWPGRG
jgi:CO/xanthine dehydrogenase Mo-binding subunit